MYRLTFYVPASHLESVKDAVFAAGAGSFGNYDRCAWQTLGQGQFRPLAGSQPFLGETETLHRLDEYKVETLVTENLAKAVAQALLLAHPYQQPAYGFCRIFSLDDLQ